MKSLYCYDNEIIKWVNKDELYCLHIQHDDEADNNPRWWDDHDSVMACFHPRYRLGDKIDASTPEEFWNDLVWKYCDDTKVVDALVNKKLFDTCAIQYHDCDDDNDYWAICVNNSGSSEWIPNKEEYAWRNLFYDDLYQYSKGEFSIRDCQILLNNYIAWLPLYLTDHSNLIMRCDAKYCDKCDTSKVGWIVTAIPDGSDSYKNAAEQIMREEVKTYSDYLSGENYRYTLYKDVHGEWKEIDTAGGFIGCDVLQNGIAYSAGNCLESALLNDECRIGDAEKVVTVTWNFDKC